MASNADAFGDLSVGEHLGKLITEKDDGDIKLLLLHPPLELADTLPVA